MTTIKIDDKEYDLDTLSDKARVQVANLQVTDGEIQRLNMQLAMNYST